MFPRKVDFSESDLFWNIKKYVLTNWYSEIKFLKKDSRILFVGSDYSRDLNLIFKSFGYNQNNSQHSNYFNERILNTFSLKEQFSWAVGISKPSDRLWFNDHDEQLNPKEEIRKGTLKTILDSDIIVIIPSNAEIYHIKSDIEKIFWRIPNKKQVFDREINYRYTSIHENVLNMSEIVRIVNDIKPEIKIIIFPSPVKVAFSHKISTLSWNLLTKTILLASISEVCQKNENCYYFPCLELFYEMPADLYNKDFRHPLPETEKIVFEMFLELFSENELV